MNSADSGKKLIDNGNEFLRLAYCPSSKSTIQFPAGLKEIGASAFVNSKMHSVYIPETVDTIDKNAFRDCCCLSEIIVDGKNEYYSSFDGMLFSKNNDKLIYCPQAKTSAKLPFGVRTIQDAAFLKSKITYISIPDTVSDIGEFAFDSCSSLSCIDLCANIETIRKGTFRNCSCLGSVIIPDSVISIEDEAFYGCSSLASVKIPENLKDMGNSVFAYCLTLISVTLPKRLTFISENIFKHCIKLSSIIIPNRVIKIKANAFYGCENLTGISFPESVVTIEHGAFSECSSLETVILPNGIKIIEDAFVGCSKLRAINVPESLSNIHTDAFKKCFEIPEFVKDMIRERLNNKNEENAKISFELPKGIRLISSSDPEFFLIDYNQKFANAKPISFRDQVIFQTLATLICKDKPNALLIGAAGAGKTKIVEDIAHKLATDDPLIPNQLKGYTIFEMPVASVVSGSNYVGDLEQKITNVINFATAPDKKVILFIDEIHTLCDESNPTYGKIAQILKPALARDTLKCIAATTLQESTNLFRDPAFNRRFTRVIVDEFTQEQTVEILKNCLPDYLEHYDNQFTISEENISLIVPIADQFTHMGSHRPDNAMSLFDKTIAGVLIDIRNKIIELESNCFDPNTIQGQQLQKELEILKKPPVEIKEDDIRKTAVRMMKGNAAKNTIDFDSLINDLKVIKGQDNVIEEVLKIIWNNEKGLFPRKKPLTILFTGTSGVGKTEITRIISERITGKEPIVLNMTEYTHSSAINQIIGSNMGYVGSDSKIELPFDCLESNPYQIILLDEFEKGHVEIQRLFMQVFDDGVLKTNRGTTLDFSKAIIIATTNAANKEISKHMGFENTGEFSHKDKIKELKLWFDTELLNRFEHIINFNSIDEDTFITIIEDKYEREVSRIRKIRHYVLKDKIESDKISEIKKNFIPDLGARPAQRIVQEYIEQQVQ